MRIAIAGSHATGKSTLVRELADRHRGFTVIDEPYYVLLDEGHGFGDPPTGDDFELLLERSVSAVIGQRSTHVLFDRSPADYLAYLSALSGSTVRADLVVKSAEALATLDLVVFVPIEQPDRIDGADAPRLRRRVDRLLRAMLVEGDWGFEVPVIEVRGTPRERAEQVETHRGAAGWRVRP